MTPNELIDRYFDWMYQLVVDDRYSKQSYRKLFFKLHGTEFTYTIPMDGNRAEDGIDLRYRFGRENHYSDSMIASYLDNTPCSILEMMIALSLRCEEHIMDNPDGLGSMDDTEFDRDYVDMVLKRFLARDYQRNGRGGLFTVYDPRQDMRSMEIWYQLNCYLREIIREGSIT